MSKSWSKIRRKYLAKWFAKQADDYDTAKTITTASESNDIQSQHALAEKLNSIFAEADKSMSDLSDRRLRKLRSSKAKSRSAAVARNGTFADPSASSSKILTERQKSLHDEREENQSPGHDKRKKYTFEDRDDEVNAILEDILGETTSDLDSWADAESIAASSIYYDAIENDVVWVSEQYSRDVIEERITDDIQELSLQNLASRSSLTGSHRTKSVSGRKSDVGNRVGFALPVPQATRCGLGIPDESQSTFRYGLELIYKGSFSLGEKYFAKRAGAGSPLSGLRRTLTGNANSNTGRVELDRSYAWKPIKPHPRDLLFLAEAVVFKVWLTGDEEESKRCLDLTCNAQERAEAALKEVEAALSTVSPNSDRAKILRFDWEDTRLALADAVLFRACMEILSGFTVRGLYHLRSAWSQYEKSGIHKKLAPMNLDSIFITDGLETAPRCKTEDASEDSSRSIRCIRWESLVWPKNELDELEEYVCRTLEAREYVGLNAGWRFGVGFYMSIVAMAPPTLVKVLEAVGFVANRELGIRLLLEGFAVASLGDPPKVKDERRPESGLVALNSMGVPMRSVLCGHTALWDLLEYSFLQASEKELSDAQKLKISAECIHIMLERFPDSPLFLWLMSVGCRKQGLFLDALSLLERASQVFAIREGLRKKALSIGITMPERMMTDAVICCTVLRAHEQTLKYGKAVLSAPGTNDFPVFSLVCLGLTYAQLGRMDDARREYTNGASLQTSRPLSDTEILFQAKSKSLQKRSSSWIAYSEFIVCTFMHELLLPKYIHLFLPELEKSLEQLKIAVKEASNGLIGGRNPSVADPQAQNSLLTNGNSKAGGAGGLLSRLGLSSTEISSATASASASKSPVGPSIDEIIIAHYCIGALLRILGKHAGLNHEQKEQEACFASSLDHLKEAYAANIKEEKWIRPYCLYDLAALYAASKDMDKAEKHLHEIKACSSGYEGESALNSRRKKLRTLLKMDALALE